MPYATLEIRQINDDLEPLFQVWVRAHIQVKIENEPDIKERKLIRQELGEPNSVAPPSEWPIPADYNDNLASAWEWYIEEYSLFQTQVTTARAQHVWKAFFDWGQYNFRQLFNTQSAVNCYYNLADTALSHEISIEIYSDNPAILAWPWEGMVDDNNDFLGQIMSIERRFLSETTKEMKEENTTLSQTYDSFNTLLVTAREINDVDYRLIGKELVELTNTTLLSPPTLQELKKVLADTSRRWDMLHFDCHGNWGSLYGSEEQGYILLSDGKLGLEPVTANQLIDAMGPATPKHIFLNACRSGKSVSKEKQGRNSIATALLQHPNIQDIVAMTYNLSVDAVRHFLYYYYEGVMSGKRPSVGLQNGRLMMASDPFRSCIGGKVILQDWMVPVIYLKGHKASNSFYNRAHHLQLNVNFVGRDNLFFFLDQLLNFDFQVYSIYGLVGQGKTTFIKEYLKWRHAIGDETPSLWIDFELVLGYKEVLYAMADVLKISQNQKKPEIDKIRALLIEYFNQHNYRIIWDHLDIINDKKQNLSSIWQVADLDNLSLFMEELASGKTTIITASRVPQKWLEKHNQVLLPIEGLDQMQSWQFINQYIETSLISKSLESRIQEEKPFMDILVKQCMGHPAVQKLILEKFVEGESAEKLVDYLKGRHNISTDEIQNDTNLRFRDSLECFKHINVKRILPFLSLFYDVLDEDLLLRVMTRTYGPLGKSYYEDAINVLGTSGLLMSKKILHPLLLPALNSYPVDVIDSDLDIFLQVLGEVLQDSEQQSLINLYTIQKAFDISILKKPEFTLYLYKCLKPYYVSEKMWSEFYFCSEKVLDILYQHKNYKVIINVILDVIEQSIRTRNVEKLNTWAERAIQLQELLPNKMLPKYRVEVIYQKAKIAQMYGRESEYVELIKQASEKSMSIKNKGALKYINLELAQIKLRTEGGANAEKNLDYIEEELLTNHSSIFRTKAQALINEQNFDEARFCLQRAIVLSKKEKDKISWAMNISLLGELEAQDGDIRKAQQLINEATDIFEKNGDRFNAGISYHQLAKHFYNNNLLEEAMDYFIHSGVCFKDAGEDHMLHVVKQNFNHICSKLKDHSVLFMMAKWTSAGLP